jgi:hypothetical protein
MKNEENEFGFVSEETADEGNTPSLPAPRSVLIRIPEETLEEIVAMADDHILWMKATQFGFSHDEKVISEIRGIIIQAEPYLVKFEGIGKPPIKKPHVLNDSDIPEGFERRCDIKIDVGDGQIIGVSLSKSSFRRGLAPYLKYLRNQGLHPHDVVTIMRTRLASNQFGQFPVIDFMVAGEPSPPESGPAQPAQREAKQSANNPWA